MATYEPLLEPLLEEHSSMRINVLAFSPDGTRFASGGTDGEVYVYDSETGELSAFLEGHDSDVSAIAFSPSGRHIVTGSDAGDVCIWGATTGSPVFPSSQIYSSVCSIVFAPRSAQFVCSQEGHMWVGNAETGERFMAPPILHTGRRNNTIMFSPEGHCLVVSLEERTLRSWDLTTGEVSPPMLVDHPDDIVMADISQDGTQVVSYNNESIRVWNVKTRALLPSAPPLSSGAPPLDCRMEDGWVVGPQGELLIWVPHGIREGFFLPRNVSIMGAETTKVDWANFPHGEAWTKCYVGG
jgi:WD40 repeat protein